MDSPDQIPEDASHGSYQEQHIHFVSTEHGTSIIEILLIMYSITLLPLLTSLLLPWFVPATFNQYTKYSPKSVAFTRIVMEFLVIITTSILIVTIFAGTDHPNEDPDKYDDISVHEHFEHEEIDSLSSITSAQCVAVTLTFICIGMLVVNSSFIKPIWLGISGHWKKIKDKRIGWSTYMYLFEEENYLEKQASEKSKQRRQKIPTPVSAKLPFITNYRGLVTYLTVISILAVDFSIFPRRFCKTKLYGFGLMDIGTGSFVFANGIVSPEAKVMKSNLKKSLKSCIPILILGIIRLLTVKGLEYHEVVEEYGVHWNFFFTLATSKVLSALVFSFVPTTVSLKAATCLSCIYEIALVYFSLQADYVLNNNIPRDTGLIAANREGIFSTVGYTAIYLGSIYIGQIIYNSSRARETIHDWCIYALESFAQITILWIATYTAVTYGNSSCRRAANLSYILWILATNYTVLWLSLMVQLVQEISQSIGILYGPLLYHEIYEKTTDGKLDADLMKAHLDRPASDDAEVDEALPEENVLESIEERLNNLQEKLNQRKESIGSPEDEDNIEDFTQDIESEFERVSKEWSSELEKTVKKQKKTTDKPHADTIRLPNLARSPITLEAICYNGLFVFLLGNLLTGVINMSVYTIFVPTFTAFSMLWGYASCIVLVSVTLYWCQIQVKFW